MLSNLFNLRERSARKQNVDSVKANLLRPSLTAYFAVEIPFPNGEIASQLKQVLSSAKQPQLNLLCTDASLPGSQLATMDIKNDRTGVSEKHAYRRMFDDRVDFTFYVDADNYLPIRFFETWMKGIMNENEDAVAKSYQYKPTYPDEYMADQGLKIFKFERDYKQLLTYEFFRSFPISISSMPVSYSGNDLLKCTVSMSYIRYIQSGPTTNTLGLGGSTFANAARNTPEEVKDLQNKALAQSFADDTGRSLEDAAILSQGGTIETVIG